MTSLILRIIALISITCNGVAVALVDGTKYYTIYVLLRSIGQMAIPLSTFLVVEGFHRTTNRRFYFLRLFAFGIAGMMPYLYMSNVGLGVVSNAIQMYSGDTTDMSASDILIALKPTIGDYCYSYYSDLLKATGSSIIDGMVTLSLSLLMLIVLDKIRAKYFGKKALVFALLTSVVIFMTILIGAILYMDYCVYIPLFVCLFYFQRGNKQSISIMTVMISILFYTSGSLAYASAIIIAVLLIFSYNGREGIEKYKKEKNSFLVTKYAMYSYYPISMLVIFGLSHL